jgi:amino acid adenylation domain-containing protein
MCANLNAETNFNLALPFYESARKHPIKLALWADGKEFSYKEMLEEVLRTVNWLCLDGATPKRVGILASRSSDACIGILAATWVGAAYVPINLALPEAGLIGILNRSSLDALIADSTGSKILSAHVLEACPAKVLARQEHIPDTATSSTMDYHELRSSISFMEPVFVDQKAPGYMIYTSGSTGVPKAVAVPVGAVDHFFRALDIKYPLTENDRVVETSPTSGDISVYNMFSTWRAGASLHIIPESQVMAPAKFIQEHRITMWYSVPSIAALMAKMDFLKPGAFPSLRQTMFCGEPLLSSTAAAWQAAAPFSTVTNMYGPTEATVMCLGEDYGPGCAVTRDWVAIGRPYPGMKAAIATPELHWVADGESGELLLSGPQLALGYVDNEEKTRSSFVEIDDERWYRTGDLAYKDSNGVFHFLGRIDHQVKVLGYRIELGEVECHLRDVSGCDSVAAVAWPQYGGSASGIVAFLGGFAGPTSKLKAAMQQRLPNYMVPSRFLILPELPLNSNRKVDRKKLLAMLNQQSSVETSR